MIRVFFSAALNFWASEAAMEGSGEREMELEAMRPDLMTRWMRAEGGNQSGSGGWVLDGWDERVNSRFCS